MAEAGFRRQGTPGDGSRWNLESIGRRLALVEAKVDKSGAALPATGEFFGQKFYVTATGKWHAWNGSSWDSLN